MLLSSKFSNHLLLLAHIYALRAGDAAYCYYTSYVAWSMSVCIVMYAASAWRGLASTSDRQRIDRARRNGYCASDLPSFDELCDDADVELFNKTVRLSNHVLHSLLPPPSSASQRYNLRNRTHLLQLPDHTTHLSDKNIITHMLYKNAYRYSSLLLHCYM